jgi:transposase
VRAFEGPVPPPTDSLRWLILNPERLAVPEAGSFGTTEDNAARTKRADLFLNRTGFLGDLISWEDGVYGTSESVFAGGARARGPDGGRASRGPRSEWAVLQSVAPKLGCTAETLRKWVRQAQRDTGHRPGLTTSERERLKELERENRELKRANEILRKASAYFAQAELDRRGK